MAGNARRRHTRTGIRAATSIAGTPIAAHMSWRSKRANDDPVSA